MTAGADPIRFADHARLVPIVRKFAGRLREQLAHAREAADSGDLEVARLAHWLAGAAGTVGYDAFHGAGASWNRPRKGGHGQVMKRFCNDLTTWRTDSKCRRSPLAELKGRMTRWT